MRLVVLLVCLLMAGCTVAPWGVHVEPVLVLSYTLHNDAGEDREAYPGPHCGTARMEDGRLRIDRNVFRDQGRGASGLVVVLPHLGPGWVTTGSEGYPLALPAEVPTGIPGEATPVGRVSWDDGPRLDGEAVVLPHTWIVHGDGWRAEARLEEGPNRVQTYRPSPCM